MPAVPVIFRFLAYLVAYFGFDFGSLVILTEDIINLLPRCARSKVM